MSETSNKTRLEHDCIGQMEVPANVYWGIHTQRAIGNFPVSGITDSQHPELIRAYATVKRACAIANEELGLIDLLLNSMTAVGACLDRARVISLS